MKKFYVLCGTRWHRYEYAIKNSLKWSVMITSKQYKELYKQQ